MSDNSIMLDSLGQPLDFSDLEKPNPQQLQQDSAIVAKLSAQLNEKLDNYLAYMSGRSVIPTVDFRKAIDNFYRPILDKINHQRLNNTETNLKVGVSDLIVNNSAAIEMTEKPVALEMSETELVIPAAGYMKRQNNIAQRLAGLFNVNVRRG
ncbi:MAG: hypothetical protein LBJ18_03500 [Rickettsiales bacterium]|jgi:hypothetical protein|nr:hypothetical protein [Rickettsiales bacterium]